MKTKNKIFVIILEMVTVLLLNIIPVFAFAGFPVIQWNGCRGGINTPPAPVLPVISTDNASCIQQTTDGGYIVIGSTNSIDGDNAGNVAGLHISGSNTDVWVLRLDSLGNILWQKCYGGTGIDNGRFIIQTMDGGFAFVATINSTDGDILPGIFHLPTTTTDAWLVKITSLGVIQWQKCLGGSGTENASCLVQSFDSTYLVSASTNFSDGDILFGVSTFHPNGTNSDSWIVKLSKNGVILWQKCYGGTGIEITNSLIQAKDSNYIFAGNMNSIDGDNAGNVAGFHIPTTNSDSWILKLSKNGVILWQKCYGGTGLDQALSIKQTFTGGYVINGTTTSSNSGDVPLGANHGSRDVWFLKISPTGVLQLQKCFGGSGSDQGNCIIQTTDSGFVLANIVTSASVDGDLVIGGSTYNGFNKNDVWLIKIDSLANLKYQKCYGGTDIENLPWIVQTRDKGYVFETSTLSNITVPGCNPPQHFTGSSDIWIVKLMDPLPPLPIKLIYFKAKKMKDKVELSWSTASEINNNYFTIEKSIDGFMYQEIGQVSGAGNSSQILNYSFFDDNPFHGVAYYRLTQTDYNGESETFPPIAIEFTDDKQVVKTILYDTQGREVIDSDSLGPGIYFLISYDKEDNIIERNKLFK